MIRLSFRLCVPLLLAAALAACAVPKPVTWTKPGASDADRQAAEGQCRQQARSRVERDVQLERLTDPDMPLASSTNIRQNLQRYDAERRIKRMVEDCMRLQGYTPVTSGSGN